MKRMKFGFFFTLVVIMAIVFSVSNMAFALNNNQNIETAEKEQAAQTILPPLMGETGAVSPGDGAFASFENSVAEFAANAEGTTSEDVECAMPANQLTEAAANGVRVTAAFEKGVFPAGTTMRVTAVSTDEVIQTIESSVSGEVVDAAAVDITFYDENGNEVQPVDHTKVHIDFTSDNEVEGSDYVVVHIGDEGAQQVADASATEASFDATSFSIYAIIGQPAGMARITYEFYDDADTPNLLATRIVKNGDTLISPGTPVSTVTAAATFLGWSSDEDPTTYQIFGEVTVPGTVTEDTTVKLYARFGNTHHVIFHNQYDEIVQSFSVEDGSDFHIEDYNYYVIFPVPVDQAVVSWSTVKADEGGIEPGLGDMSGAVTDLTDITSDVHLYPVLESAYWITYISNGGSFTAPDYFKFGSDTAEPDAPTKYGYTFAGWYTDETMADPFSFGSPLSGNITLYAKWNEDDHIPYTVVYWVENADDDGYSLLEADTLYGVVDTMTAASANPSDATIDGNLYTLNGEITQKTIDGDGSTVVNVNYNRTVKNIYFYTAASRGTSNENIEIPELRITAKWGSNIAGLWPGTVDPDTYDINWYVGDTGGTMQAGIDTMPTTDEDFWEHAKESGNTYKFYHYLELLDGETSEITYNDKYFGTEPITDIISTNAGLVSTVEDCYPITGFTYMGNISYANGAVRFDPDNTLTFYYSRNSYNINFFSNGSLLTQLAKQYEAGISDAAFTPDDSQAPVSGYVFQGWYDNQDCVGDPVTLSGTMPAHDITLYAKWGWPNYDIHFDLNGGTSSEIEDQTDMYGKLVLRPDDPAMAGYVFAGWTLGGVAYDFDHTYVSGDVLDFEVDGVITLHANWIGGTNFQVQYNAAAGSAAPADANWYYNSAEVVVASAATPPDGKYFLYWMLKDGSTYYPGSAMKLDATQAEDHVVTLTAVYGEDPASTYLTYHPNGGTGSDYTTGAVRNNGQIEILASGDEALNYERRGFVFNGWNTAADGSGTNYAAGDAVNIDNVGSNDLYAQWRLVISVLDSDDHFKYVVGYPDGTVQPGGDITRAEVATIFYRLLTAERRDEIFTGTNNFSDVTGNLWYNKAVSSMEAGKYVLGYPDGSFHGDLAITRAEFIAIAVRFADPQVGTVSLSDVSTDHWAYNYIATAEYYGWVTGYTDGTFQPDDPITRAEAMTIINRMLNRGVEEAGVSATGFTPWPDNDSSAWYYYEVIEATNDHEYTGNRPYEIWTSLTTDYTYDIDYYEKP